MADPVEKSNSCNSKLGRGFILEPQSKEIIPNVYDYFNNLHAKGKSTGPFKQTLEATGLLHINK